MPWQVCREGDPSFRVKNWIPVDFLLVQLQKKRSAPVQQCISMKPWNSGLIWQNDQKKQTKWRNKEEESQSRQKSSCCWHSSWRRNSCHSLSFYAQEMSVKSAWPLTYRPQQCWDSQLNTKLIHSHRSHRVRGGQHGWYWSQRLESNAKGEWMISNINDNNRTSQTWHE